jgi:hypothetical protein
MALTQAVHPLEEVIGHSGGAGWYGWPGYGA